MKIINLLSCYNIFKKINKPSTKNNADALYSLKDVRDANNAMIRGCKVKHSTKNYYTEQEINRAWAEACKLEK